MSSLSFCVSVAGTTVPDLGRAVSGPEHGRTIPLATIRTALIVSPTHEKLAASAQSRRIETEAAPVRYVAELVGADTDSERAIRWLIALMVLCCDPPAIVLTGSGIDAATNHELTVAFRVAKKGPVSTTGPGAGRPCGHAVRL